ncbi:MAG: cyclic nucleotide-binding domain-containing protein [Desulfamplus sp.]|nr:cyclic nucleotide-binding domain-containing protein [Desulfamplus sp.]
MVKIQDLKQIAMLESMPEHLLLIIGQEARLSIFSSGTCLFKAGDIVDNFYMLIMGQVALTVALNPDMDVILENIQSGRAFGSTTLISGGPAYYSAVCQEPCETITLSGPNMRKIFEKDHELAFYMMNGVARQYKKTMDRRAKMIVKTLERHPELKASIHDIGELAPVY